MRQLPLIVSPNPRSLLAIEGGEVAVVAVQVERSEIAIHFCVLVDDAAREEEEYGRAMDEWAAADPKGELPPDPAERRFRGLTISLSDNTGERYLWRRSTIGGSGRFFRAECYFAGSLPDDAAELTIEATREPGEHGSMVMPIQ